MDENEVRRVARAAAESVYGVAAVVGPRLLDRVLADLRLGTSGVIVSRAPPRVTVDLHVAPGVPAEQVAQNVAVQVRYTVERDLGVHLDEVAVRVEGRPMPTDGSPERP